MKNEIKAVSKTDTELRVANYIVLFGGKDLAGEFFTEKTQLESSYTKSGLMHIDFEHGRDPDGAGLDTHEVMGYVDWKTAKFDENGVFVERVLNRQAKYMKHIERLIEAGVVGTSSQAISGKAKRNSAGEIIAWPLMRDSLTLTPMEPRMISQNILHAAKSLLEDFPESKSLAELAATGETGIIEKINEIKTVRDLETFLRDSGGFGRGATTAIVAQAKKAFEQRESGQDDIDAKAISELLQKRLDKFKVPS